MFCKASSRGESCMLSPSPIASVEMKNTLHLKRGDRRRNQTANKPACSGYMKKRHIKTYNLEDPKKKLQKFWKYKLQCHLKQNKKLVGDVLSTTSSHNGNTKELSLGILILFPASEGLSHRLFDKTFLVQSSHRSAANTDTGLEYWSVFIFKEQKLCGWWLQKPGSHLHCRSSLWLLHWDSFSWLHSCICPECPQQLVPVHWALGWDHLKGPWKTTGFTLVLGQLKANTKT